MRSRAPSSPRPPPAPGKAQTVQPAQPSPRHDGTPGPSPLVLARDPLFSGPIHMPMSLVGNQHHVKLALMLAAVDPINLGSVCIAGPRGSGKTILARSLHALLPPIRVARGPNSWWNAPPEEEGGEGSDGGGSEGFDVREPPFVTVPLGVTEDRVVGTVELEQSLKEGRSVLQPGLLATCNRGILYLDEANLQDESIRALVQSAVTAGFNVVEREGLSAEHPCRPILIATYNEEEGSLGPSVLDRFAMVLTVSPMSQEARLAATEATIRWQDRGPGGEGSLVQAALEEAEEGKLRIAVARELLPYVRITPDQVRYLCTEASRAACEGQRAEIFAARAAQAHAALHGRDRVGTEDLVAAVRLCIAPRAMANPDLPDMRPPPPTPPQQKKPESKEEEDKEREKQRDPEQEAEPPPPPEEEEMVEMAVPEFMFSPEGVILDEGLLEAMKFTKHGPKAIKAGRSKSAIVYSFTRGRYVRPVLPKGKPVRLAVDATLRAAAPHQLARRRLLQMKEQAKLKDHKSGDASAADVSGAAPPLSKEEADRRARQSRRVLLDMSDVRVKRLARRCGSLFLFVVDASGSMALHRMAAAKGATEALLAESYRRRDQVALITCSGRQAQVLLPPSRAVELARRRLAVLPTGGGTPVAHALSLAARAGLAALKRGGVRNVRVVLLTDGRANVPLAVSERSGDGGDAGRLGLQEGSGPGVVLMSAAERAMVEDEVKDVARSLAMMGLALTVVDTSPGALAGKRSSLAQEIAKAAAGVYVKLPSTAGARELFDVTKRMAAAADGSGPGH